MSDTPDSPDTHTGSGDAPEAPGRVEGGATEGGAPQSPAPQPQQPSTARYAPPQLPSEPVQPQYAPQPGSARPQYAPQQEQHPQYAQQPGSPVYTTPYQTGRQAGEPRPPKKGLSTGAIIGIVAGAAALLLLFVGGLVWLLIPSAPGGSGGGDAARSPEQTVEQYLQALSDADAEAATALLASPRDSPLLTQEVLEASQELAPITDIEVDPESVVEDEYGDLSVSASFKVGDEAVTRDFSLYESSDGWTLLDGTTSMSLASFSGLDPTVNGAEVSEDYADVFIGGYEIGLGSDYFELPDGGMVVLATFDDASNIHELKPALTEAATQKYRELVRASLNECLAMKTLATPCTRDLSGTFSDGAVPVEGTATRTLTAEGEAALSALKPELSVGQPQLVITYDTITVSTTLEADKDGMRGTGEVIMGGGVLSPSVDFSKETLSVTWD